MLLHDVINRVDVWKTLLHIDMNDLQAKSQKRKQRLAASLFSQSSTISNTPRTSHSPHTPRTSHSNYASQEQENAVQGDTPSSTNRVTFPIPAANPTPSSTSTGNNSLNNTNSTTITAAATTTTATATATTAISPPPWNSKNPFNPQGTYSSYFSVPRTNPFTEGQECTPDVALTHGVNTNNNKYYDVIDDPGNESTSLYSYSIERPPSPFDEGEYEWNQYDDGKGHKEQQEQEPGQEQQMKKMKKTKKTKKGRNQNLYSSEESVIYPGQRPHSSYSLNEVIPSSRKYPYSRPTSRATFSPSHEDTSGIGTRMHRHRGSTAASVYEIDSTSIVSSKNVHQTVHQTVHQNVHQNVHSLSVNDNSEDYRVEYHEEEEEEEEEKHLSSEGKAYDFTITNFSEHTSDQSDQEVTPTPADEELTIQPGASAKSSISLSSYRQSLRLKQIRQIGLISEDCFRCRFTEISRSKI